MHFVKLFLCAMLSMTLGCANSPEGTRSILDQDFSRPLTKSDITALALDIITFHERTLGIHYCAPVPKIVFGFSGRDDAHAMNFVRGQYVSATAQIHLHEDYRAVDVAKLHRGEVTTQEPSTTSDIREILSHELGHYFTEILIAREGIVSWLNEHHRRSKTLGPDDIGVFVIREGIGTYFERLAKHPEPIFAESTWSNKISLAELNYGRVRIWLFYEGGYAVAKPIIDAHGIRGICYLLTHRLKIEFPGVEELMKYRDEALRALSSHKAPHTKTQQPTTAAFIFAQRISWRGVKNIHKIRVNVSLIIIIKILTFVI